MQINGNSICLIMGECSMIYDNHLKTMTFFFSSTVNHFFLILSIIMIKIIIFFKYLINYCQIEKILNKIITVLLHFTR